MSLAKIRLSSYGKQGHHHTQLSLKTQVHILGLISFLPEHILKSESGLVVSVTRLVYRGATLNRYPDSPGGFGNNITAVKAHWVLFGENEKRDWSCPGTCTCYQIAEARFKDIQENQISPVSVTNPGGNNPNTPSWTHTPGNLIDYNIYSKFLDFNNQPVVFAFNSGFQSYRIVRVGNWQ